LINTGVLALSRETSTFSGFGQVVGKSNWSVVRVSQEHGIVGLNEKGIVDGKERVEDSFKVGDKVYLWVQHSCITAAAFYAYYVVDDEDVVKETWIPWKGW
jgi:D-serine deaminase-like pyridoxal phosphate-dependent protein